MHNDRRSMMEARGRRDQERQEGERNYASCGKTGNDRNKDGPTGKKVRRSVQSSSMAGQDSRERTSMAIKKTKKGQLV